MAKRQRGYIKRVQLLKLGLGSDAIAYRVRIGRLIPVYAGVYAVGHLPTLPQDRAVGALLACGEGAVLSHSTAATAWGIFKRWEMPFEVSAPTNRRRTGIIVHRTRLERCDIRTQIGLRVTSAARTLLDVAPRFRDKGLRRAIADQRRAGHLHMDELVDVVDRFPRAPGTHRLRPLLNVPRGGPTRSGLEDKFVAFCIRSGLPEPETNVWVAGREVDAWFPRERLIVELDGYEFHSDPGTFEGDRDNDATALALGIPTVRVTEDRIDNRPEEEARRLHVILEHLRDS
ncbi:MAG TPA: type IV toxin-antitoxin system AbiEi family antitoxin domain-containing protein [Solirubrobacteraceae bacterium]|nr:type IV toxin-antitoxin system AbiEi family antitoxin domain-containing protein [Solirubrobacteraceae bacterium]